MPPKSRGATGGGATAGLTAQETKARESKSMKIVIRVGMSLCLIGGFLGIIFAGHPYLVAFVALIQVGLFRELVNVRFKRDKDEKVPLFRTLQWSFFFVAMVHVYKNEFVELGLFHKATLKLPPAFQDHFRSMIAHSSFITFTGYVGIFVIYVLTLRKETMKYQIGNLFWTIGVLCLIVLQIRGTIDLIFAGIFWFILPCGLVVANDCFAYICGMCLGKKLIDAPFLTISPNKTWEGFIGAVFCTVAFSWVFADIISRFKWLTCPQHELSLYATVLDCQPSHEFNVQSISWPFDDYALLVLQGKPAQMHAVKLAFFASLMAPFGGFLASGMKRAYNIKDFGDLIPGHGGFMDRMDCQLLMLLFTYVYYQTFVRAGESSEVHIMRLIHGLPLQSQEAIYKKLAQSLNSIAGRPTIVA